MATSKESAPLTVAVIGGGLVGSMAAAFFARRGHRVELYEYREDPRCTRSAARGRTINLSLAGRGRCALARLGLESAALGAALPMRGRLLHLTEGLRSALYDPQGGQCIYSVDRNQLNEMLLNDAENYPNVKFYFQHKLIRADLETGNLTFEKADNYEKFERQVDLVIGADGAFSTVRRHMLRRPMFQFSQTYIQHGYMELAIPPTVDGSFAIPPGYLHVWPRGEFMMIALPNLDKSWTVTLFLPFEIFNSLGTPHKLLEFFDEHFPDAVQLIGKGKLVEDFFKIKPSPLVSIKCYPYNVADRAILLGDAAHAMVPFYGQGMNAGFEDCAVLDELMDTMPLDQALTIFSETRSKDAHAICDLAIYNFKEMRSLVVNASWSWRRRADVLLHSLLGRRWRPLYQTVAFSTIPYSACLEHRRWQDKVINYVTTTFLSLMFLISALVIIYY